MVVTKLDDLVPWMAQRLPGCQDAAMIQALQDAWRKFCERSEWFRPDVDINITATNQVYRLIPPAIAHIRKIPGCYWRQPSDVAANLDGRLLAPTAYAVIENPDGSFSISLQWVPGTDAHGALRVKPVLVPALATDQPPPMPVLERWGEVFAHGAVMMLAKHPGKKYTNSGVATDAETEWNRGISTARRQNVIGLAGHNQTLKPQTYFPAMPVGQYNPWLPSV